MVFIINSILLGIGLAIDAFSVTVANSIREHNMKKKRMFQIAGTFGLFQFAMPLIGWVLVHTVATLFSSLQKYIPWVGAALLIYLGIKMIIEKEEEGEQKEGNLIVQGIATSIDALTVGFTISEYNLGMALISSIIIGVVTVGICLVGVVVGKKLGDKLNKKASIAGGIILILLALEIIFF